MSLISLCATSAWHEALTHLTTLPTPPAQATLLETSGPSSWTSLHFAASTAASPSHLLHLLLDLGTPVNIPADSGSTPLHLAVWHRVHAHAQLLLDRGADVHAVTLSKRTPLHFAARQGALDLVRLLVEHAADLDAPDAHGMTPLHFAAQAGFLPVVDALVRAGASCLFADGEHASPIDVAAQAGHAHVVELLEQAFPQGPQQQQPAATISNSAIVVDKKKDITNNNKSTRIPRAATFPSRVASTISNTASTLSAGASTLARNLLPATSNSTTTTTTITTTPTAAAIVHHSLPPTQLAALMVTHATHAQPAKVAQSYRHTIETGVQNYHLTAPLLLAQHPAPEVLVNEILIAAAESPDPQVAQRALFHSLVNFVKEARRCAAVQHGIHDTPPAAATARPAAARHALVTRKEVYAAVGAGVLVGLLVPLTRGGGGGGGGGGGK